MKTIPIIAFLSIFIILNTNHLVAQERFRVGFQIAQLQNDFGLGVQLNLPVFKRQITLQLAATNHWREIRREGTLEATSYQALRLGTMGGWMVAEKIKVYGAGGVMVVLPGNELASKSSFWGGYGVFGFEFFAGQAQGSSLFLEMGGGGANGTADRVAGQPTMGAGLLLQSGLRVAF